MKTPMYYGPASHGSMLRLGYEELPTVS